MEQNNLDRPELYEEEEGQISDTVMGDIEKNTLPPRDRFLIGCVYARYVLPLFTVLLSFVFSFFYNVEIYSGGKAMTLSIGRLFLNTFAGTHQYLGGETNAGRTWFYGVLSVGAILGILCFLVALFLTGLAAYTAVKAFRAGYKSEESNRMKLIFKIPFPNRVWFYLSNLLVLLPLLDPHFVATVGGRFLAIGGEDVIFVVWNTPLFVCAILCLVTLGLALLIPRTERAKRMNMFLLHHPEEENAECEEEDDEL